MWVCVAARVSFSARAPMYIYIKYSSMLSRAVQERQGCAISVVKSVLCLLRLTGKDFILL
jgi:hypothetical protein